MKSEYDCTLSYLKTTFITKGYAVPFPALPAFAYDFSEWKALSFQETPTYSSVTFLMNVFLLLQLPESNSSIALITVHEHLTLGLSPSSEFPECRDRTYSSLPRAWPHNRKAGYLWSISINELHKFQIYYGTF